MHVFEHLENPKENILKIKKILKKKGMLIMSIPTSESIGLRIGKQYHFHLDTPRHLFIPSIKAIKKILKESGFKKIKIHSQPFEFPLDLFWSIRKSPFKYIIYPFYPLIKILNKETFTVSALA